jgi:hypothetical protein
VIEIGSAAPNLVFVKTRLQLYLFFVDRLPEDRQLDEYGIRVAQDRIDRGVQSVIDCAASFGYSYNRITEFANRLKATGWVPKSVRYDEPRKGSRLRREATRDRAKATKDRSARMRAFSSMDIASKKHRRSTPVFAD